MYIFELSILNLHIAPTWYWLSYAIWFIICYTFVKRYFKFRDSSHIDTLLSYIFFWIIIGWRAWYILLYNFSYFLENPIKIMAVWEWWMSFHGWFIGTVFAVYIFSKKYSYKFCFWSHLIGLFLHFHNDFFKIHLFFSNSTYKVNLFLNFIGNGG